MTSGAPKSQFILFGDSLTEWAFEEWNEGFGWFLEHKYQDKVNVICEGMQICENLILFLQLLTYPQLKRGKLQALANTGVAMLT